jgi:hypothetical protein
MQILLMARYFYPVASMKPIGYECVVLGRPGGFVGVVDEHSS